MGLIRRCKIQKMTNIKAFGMWFGNSLLSTTTFFIEHWLPGLCLAVTTVLAGWHYIESIRLKKVERELKERELEATDIPNV